jgi:hypothetical protein
MPSLLTLQSLLAGSGVSSSCAWVRKYGGRLEAHAWVEHDGMALLEAAGVHDRFTAFAGAIARSARKIMSGICGIVQDDASARSTTQRSRPWRAPKSRGPDGSSRGPADA